MNVLTDSDNRSVRPIGRIDANSSADLDKALSLFPENDRDIIVDFSDCPYLSSAGIRVLLKTKKRLTPGQAELFLTSVSPVIFQVFETAGLHKLFCLKPDLESALHQIRSSKKPNVTTHTLAVGTDKYTLEVRGNQNSEGCFWNGNEIVSYNEMGFAAGFGYPSEASLLPVDEPSFFVVAGNCTGFLPLSGDSEADFRLTSDPEKTGFLVQEALSFGHQPVATLNYNGVEEQSLTQLTDVVGQVKRQYLNGSPALLLVLADFAPQTPSISIILCNDEALKVSAGLHGLTRFTRRLIQSKGAQQPLGLKFNLFTLDGTGTPSLYDLLRHHLTFENISEVEQVPSGFTTKAARVWILTAGAFTDGTAKRLPIESDKGFTPEPHKAFLARQIYTDSSRLIVKPLHGGFSAQTFQVTSFDHEGRKMRPTVMKIAHRDLIKRESDHCKQYALPYIFNNSANVLGTVFYGETGALRYNFVGIGGEDSTLRWLTHLYQEEELTTLEPLFDKIFLQILKPWYGQPVSKPIEPFKDHDPTYTFFPHIYKTVEELFGISADDPTIMVAETGRQMLNPYWFLKHEYARRRDETIEYNTSICHGDLNMQNILLDENRNVYLIDFSETRPRSIVSDFARLEAILLVDNAPVENEAETIAYINQLTPFYNTSRLDELPAITFDGPYKAMITKNFSLTCRMRRYAFECSQSNPDLVPYILALLEWILPIVCYGLPIYQKRVSMVIASLLCEQLNRLTAQMD
ncbi:MAG TPA: hypothetical protein DEO70_14140 [Bacteroidales bacterium]|nr:MAG: hypothetical protein A2X11_13535 [Bacteroidetes bacterium GWE2_42_24]OFY26710.1 MAG: hypothetical protein A2X09_09895 [Bacteroidetes bacterium GWF2_43_11]HBZ67970.1 hypothetical protein [Bacteroidales bacterium]